MTAVLIVLLSFAYVGYYAWVQAVTRRKEEEKVQRDLAFFELQRRYVARNSEFRDNKRNWR